MISKRILIVGGTGAQGTAVVDALRKADENFTIRILTRNPDHIKAKELEKLGVEIAKGDILDTDSVARALQDCYGVYLNTDSNLIKPSDELWAAIRVYEVSKTIPTLRHLVWSGLDYHLKVMNYNPRYGTSHINAKGRVGEYLNNQSSSADEGLAWTILNTCVYMEMLAGGLFNPTIQEDGTRAFAFPLPKGHLAMIALADLAAFAVLIFKDRPRWSGRTLGAASYFATGEEIAETTARIAGVKATFHAPAYDEWANKFPRAKHPVCANDPDGMTLGESFKMFFNAFSDDVWMPLKDMKALKEMHPDLRTLEMWMKENHYDGSGKNVVKGLTDAGLGPDS